MLEIQFAVDASGNSQAEDFFRSLGQRDKAKVLTLFKYLGDHREIQNQEKFRRIDKDLWEFKAYQVRMLGDFRKGGLFVIAYGLKKKRDKHRRKDLDIARRLLQEYDQQQHKR